MLLSTAFSVATVTYLLLVKILRYRRARAIEELCKPDVRDSMSPALAQKILQLSFFYEVQTTMAIGTIVALFKVWGIVCAHSLIQ